ncbi:hypothetical protein Tco_0204274 [Tanacetum coccineum]
MDHDGVALCLRRRLHVLHGLNIFETHLCDLYLNSLSHAVNAFKLAFHSFFGEEHETFRLKMFHNLNQLRLQLERENLLEVNPRTCLEALRTQLKEFFTSKKINPVQAVDDRLSVLKSSWIESKNNNALNKLVNETQLQQHESLVTESTTLEANLSMDVNALDVGLAVTESNGTNSYKQDTSSSLGTYITHVVDADIRPVNDQVPSAKISSGHRFSPKKTSVVYEKTSPRSCLRWIPTGKIFKLAGLRWISTGKMFIDITTKVDSEPPNGSNKDITNPYECYQTLNVSAGTLNLSAGLVQNSVSLTTYVPPSKRDYEILFQPLFDEYFNPPPCAVSLNPIAVAAPRPVDPAGSPLSTTIDQDVPSASTSPTNQEIQFQVTHQDPSSEEPTLQRFIPSNLHNLNQSFDTPTKLTKNQPLENVIGDPSRPVLIRSQLHEHAIWCYFNANDNPIPFGDKMVWLRSTISKEESWW